MSRKARKLRNTEHGTYEFLNMYSIFFSTSAVVACVAIFLFLNASKLSTDQWISFAVRLIAASLFYLQGEFYRRRVLVFAPETNFSYGCTVFSAIIYTGLVGFIIFEANNWLFLLGLMMFTLSFRNAVTWHILYKQKVDKTLLGYFKKWTYSSIGYFLLIMFMSPVTYSISMLSPETRAGKLIFIPFIGPVFPLSYVDIGSAILFIVAMVISLIRLSEKLEILNRKDKKVDREEHKIK